MPTPPLRIAILECDTPLPGTVFKYGGYGGVFTSLLHSALPHVSPPLSPSDLDLSVFDVVNQNTYPQLADIDAILISGSKHNSFDNDPWILRLVEFVKEVLEQRRVRIVGVCFGHQILGRALGAQVGRSERGWEVSVTGIELTDVGKKIFGLSSLSLHQMHRDIVVSPPPEVENLAFTDKCAVQGMYVKGRFISVQGHPEFTEDIVRELVEARHKVGVLDDEIYGSAIERVVKPHDGVMVAAAFLGFLMEE